MKRYISDTDENSYTHMLKVLNSIGGRNLKYNWLITEIQAYPTDTETNSLLINTRYLVLSTNELLNVLEKEDFQWIWGVFSAIPEKYSKEEILASEIPWADGNSLIYQNAPIIQHPLADIEIVAFDSTLVQITSKDNKIAELFKTAYPSAKENY